MRNLSKFKLWSVLSFTLLAVQVVKANELPERLNRLIVQTANPKIIPENLPENLKVTPLIESLNLYLVESTERNANLNALYDQLKSSRSVQSVSWDQKMRLRSNTLSQAPDDTSFADQWSLDLFNPVGSINPLTLWGVTDGSTDVAGNEIVVAVIDGGFELAHKDLRDNIWNNKNEIPNNGLDDDGNGYVDDFNGWNAYTDSGSVTNGTHGTHVAGIVAARGNNQLQVAGINLNGKILPIQGASGVSSVVMKAYGYALKLKKEWIKSGGKKGANIVATNSSFGIDAADCSSDDYKAWNDIYNELGSVGILSAAATANVAWDIDSTGDVPTACSSDFIVSVTNTDDQDALNKSAGWGATTIDLAAPGTKILSTVTYNQIDELTGTSMATPHVAGGIALLYAAAPQEFIDEYIADPATAALKMKAALIKGVDPIQDLNGKTVSGGRLDLGNSLAILNNDVLNGPSLNQSSGENP